MRQDEFHMLTHLYNLEERFGTLSAVDYFKSEEARQSDSKARDMVESGRKSVMDFEPDQLARVVFAAIVIGGKTLHIYLNSFEELHSSKRSQAQA
jgi:hypothetical protein